MGQYAGTGGARRFDAIRSAGSGRPVERLRRRHRFQRSGFETFSWAAGIAGATNYSGIFATSHVPTVHPIMAAKQATTIDHISRGRFSLNIVTGWYKPEIEMFGAPQMSHDDRYDCAIEWFEIIKRLWTEDGEIDFDGRYYQVKGAVLAPKPLQQPYPVVMNAGGSEKGAGTMPQNIATLPSSSSKRTTSII